MSTRIHNIWVTFAKTSGCIINPSNMLKISGCIINPSNMLNHNLVNVHCYISMLKKRHCFILGISLSIFLFFVHISQLKGSYLIIIIFKLSSQMLLGTSYT